MLYSKTCAVTVLILCFLSVSAQSQETSAERYFKVLSSSSTSWDDESLPNYPSQAPEIKMVKVVIPAGESIPWHKHPSISAAFLVEGKIKLVSESDKTLILNKGDPLIELVDHWHYGESIGEVSAEILVVYVSSKGVPLTVFKK